MNCSPSPWGSTSILVRDKIQRVLKPECWLSCCPVWVPLFYFIHKYSMVYFILFCVVFNCRGWVSVELFILLLLSCAESVFFCEIQHPNILFFSFLHSLPKSKSATCYSLIWKFIFCLLPFYLIHFIYMLKCKWRTWCLVDWFFY